MWVGSSHRLESRAKRTGNSKLCTSVRLSLVLAWDML